MRRLQKPNTTLSEKAFLKQGTLPEVFSLMESLKSQCKNTNQT